MIACVKPFPHGKEGLWGRKTEGTPKFPRMDTKEAPKGHKAQRARSSPGEAPEHHLSTRVLASMRRKHKSQTVSTGAFTVCFIGLRHSPAP